jgi:hypothetical protein
MGYGLPYEYRTPDGEHEDWEAAHGYLKALEGSGRPIVVAIIDPRQEELNPRYRSHLTEQIGFLRERSVRGERPSVHWYALDWPDPEQPCGEFTIDERLFAGARLSTVDGDDYFGLDLDLGSIKLVVMDSNINMNDALNEWMRRRKGYLHLRAPITLSEIEGKLEGEPDQQALHEMKETLNELRVRLAEHGATVATNLSDDELRAASKSASLMLHTSGRMNKVQPGERGELLFETLVAALREPSGSEGPSPEAEGEGFEPSSRP